MASRINRAIELLEADQAIYYAGEHSGHVLTYEQGKADAHIWADYINVGMEHGSFDMKGLSDYMRGLLDGGPTRSGHRTPAIIMEAPVNGTDEANVRHNAWQFRQLLARGVHGILLCQTETAGAARALVESCRYPHHPHGVAPGRPTPLERMRGAAQPRPAENEPHLGIGTRGRGGEATAGAIWGLATEDYIARAEPWPLNRDGELLLGVKLESPEGVANADAILAVPGIGFAEMGAVDLSTSFGQVRVQREPFPPALQEARDRVFNACRRHGVAFLEYCTPDTIAARIDEGVRVVSGHREETAKIGRAHQKRAMPV